MLCSVGSVWWCNALLLGALRILEMTHVSPLFAFEKRGVYIRRRYLEEFWEIESSSLIEDLGVSL